MAPPDDPQLQARLQDLFLEELAEQLERLEAGLENLASGPPEAAPANVAELFRSAHSLKGAAQAVSARAIASQCHELEEALAQVRDGQIPLGAPTTNRLTRLVDTVRQQEAVLRASDGTDPQPARATAPPAGPASAADQEAPRASPVTTDAPPTPATDGGPVRIGGQRVDALMAQAGDLITVSYGSDALVERLARAGARLLDEDAQRHRERETILSTLAGTPAVPQVTAVLDRADARARATARELDELLRLVSRHQKSLRSNAASFAEAARRARMVPFAQVTSGLPRLVRELAADLGKEAELEIVETDVEVDRELVILLREVLGHLVRNAVDHGLEPPEERARAGKDRHGRVRVAASLRSDGIQVVVSDDGRGVDEQRVREAAGRRGLPGQSPADRSLADVMFSPGVSTAASVSSVSGRGVGLDAVRTTVEATGGTVRVESRPGAGTSLSLVLPLNLSTMRALLVKAGNQLVAVPSASIRRLTSRAGDNQQLAGGQVMTIDDEVVPVVRLTDLLGWEYDTQQTSPSALTGLLVATDAGVAVLTADGVLAEREVVLRASPSRIAGVRKILGTTQLDDGNVVLVLNPPACVRAAIFERPAAPPARRREETGPRSVLLAEDSLTTRELERSLLEAAGFSVLVAHDGQQAWDLLQTNDVDAVVSDVNMPRMDGIALCRAIRSSNRLQSLPVVLVTSLHSDTDRRAGLDAGADAYLTKVGFNRDDLVEALERLL